MTYSDPHDKNLKERILADISSRNTRVYPRIYFVLRTVLVAIVAILVLVVSIFIFNYVFFSLRVSGQEDLLNFGARGFSSFLEHFPWLLLALDLILTLLLEWLLRRFRFGYRSPILYLLLGIFAVTISAGYLMDRATRVDDALLYQADRNSLVGPFNEIYENIRGSHLVDEGVCECQIIKIDGNVLTARDINSTSDLPLTVVLPANYTLPSSVQAGSVVFVAGMLRPSNTVQAFGLSTLSTSDIDMVQR
jgi:preprotein translocase subunit SecG